VPIPAQDTKHVIGHAGLGNNMLLNEMFSAIGAPKEDDADIDWLDDLKFFIDNDDKMLETYMFPVLQKHEKYAGNPNVYKLYVNPLKKCAKIYCDKFEVEKPEEKFSEDKIVELARKIAEMQERFIKDGQYNKDEN
jgi:hypothetical protein